MMDKKWEYSDFESVDKLQHLMSALDVSRPIAKLLLNRGIDTFDKAKSFFRPDIQQLHDPFLMKGMDAAVNRIQDAISNNENILVYGDYDVDGTTSVALMFQYLNNFTQNIHYYIPDRYKEGYGVSFTGIDFAIDNNFTLIVALDCGVKAVEQVKKAKDNEIDFIICDHHVPGKTLPDAIILNPKQADCPYPFKDLCGCGVGFKLVQAINDTFALPFSEIDYLLDLVMVAIGADMVSVMGENRIMAYHGLKKLNRHPRIGFKSLLDLAGKKAPLTVTDVVFTIAPRINAAGRIKSGNRAVELLLSADIESAHKIGEEINNYNLERREIEKEITAEALNMIASDSDLLSAHASVLYNPNWHKGVVGIVASRLIESHYRPTVVLTQSNGFAVGSVRSIKGFNVYEALAECNEYLLQFGGHKYAAGLTLDIDQVEPFANAFNAIVKKKLNNKRQVDTVEIEEQIDFRDIFREKRNEIPKFYRILKQFAPFGPGNMKPIFSTADVRISGSPRLLKDAHLKMKVYQESDDDIILDTIGFNLSEKYKKIETKPLSIAYHIEENHWNNYTQLQLVLKDVQFVSKRRLFMG